VKTYFGEECETITEGVVKDLQRKRNIPHKVLAKHYNTSSIYISVIVCEAMNRGLLGKRLTVYEKLTKEVEGRE